MGGASGRDGEKSQRNGGDDSYTINEDAQGNVYVKGLSIIPVSTPEEVVTIIQMGLRLRATHEVRGEE
jgi:hypothetical protein